MKHNYLTLLLAVLMSSVSNISFAHDFEDDGIYYKITSSSEPLTVAVTYRGSWVGENKNENIYTGSVTIPETAFGYKTYSYKTYRVTSIGDNAFWRCRGLTSVTIPESVTSIGDFAFYGCSGLTSITIPNSVTSIGDCAFSDISYLTSVTIPNSVTSIGDCAFEGCTGLTSIVVAGDNPMYDSRDDCNAIIITSSNSLFIGCQNTIIPNSVTSIGNYAFEGCSGLTSVTIPSSVTSIGGSAFSGCYFTSDSFINKSSLSNNKNWGATIVDEETNDGLLIKDNTIVRCRPWAISVNIPESVTSIGNSAFYGCSRLKSVNIPESVTSIGEYAFYGCRRLTSVNIPDIVTSIGRFAFDGCRGLTSVTIPNSVTSIGSHSFAGCSRLKSITIPESVTSIGDDAFRDCSYLTSVTIPNSVTSIGDYAFSGCSRLKSITIPESVTSIRSYAFSGCSYLTSVTIPNSVTSIGWSAFSGCSRLTSVIIGNSVTSIGNDAFYNCSRLTKAEFASIESLCNIKFFTPSFSNPLSYAHHLYIDDKEITDLVIPNSVTSIGGSAFSGCSYLTSVTIPNSVTSIGGYAFSGCSGLTSVTINSNAIASKEYTTSSTLANIFGSQVKNYIFGEDVKSIGHYAFYNCSGLTSINIPNSVTSIGSSAFYGCTGLLSIVIGSGVNTIGDYAFQGCNNFDDFYCLAKNIPTLGYNVFKDSYYKYATLHVPSSSVKAYRSTTAAWSEFGNIVALTEEETGLSTIENGELKIDKVYDFSGRKQSQPQRGINIIRMKDGTTKKVLIK